MSLWLLVSIFFCVLNVKFFIFLWLNWKKGFRQAPFTKPSWRIRNYVTQASLEFQISTISPIYLLLKMQQNFNLRIRSFTGKKLRKETFNPSLKIWNSSRNIRTSPMNLRTYLKPSNVPKSHFHKPIKKTITKKQNLISIKINKLAKSIHVVGSSSL